MILRKFINWFHKKPSPNDKLLEIYRKTFGELEEWLECDNCEKFDNHKINGLCHSCRIAQLEHVIEIQQETIDLTKKNGVV